MASRLADLRQAKQSERLIESLSQKRKKKKRIPH